MLRLLVALVVVGLLAWWLVPRPHAAGDVAATRVRAMMQTLRDSGCDPGPSAGSDAAASLKALQAAIAGCEAHAAARAEQPAAAHP